MRDADCGPVSESGTENIFEATLMVFRGMQRTWPAAIQLKILNFLRVFFSMTELLVLAGVNFSSSPTKKETEVKLGRLL